MKQILCLPYRKLYFKKSLYFAAAGLFFCFLFGGLFLLSGLHQVESSPASRIGMFSAGGAALLFSLWMASLFFLSRVTITVDQDLLELDRGFCYFWKRRLRFQFSELLGILLVQGPYKSCLFLALYAEKNQQQRLLGVWDAEALEQIVQILSQLKNVRMEEIQSADGKSCRFLTARSRQKKKNN